MPSPFPALSPCECLLALASPTAPVLLDVRLPEDIAGFPATLPAARFAAYDDLDAHLALARGHGAIVICHKGLKISAGAVARLAARGVPAWRLTGGIVGWEAAGLPTIAIDAPRPARIAVPLDATPDEALTAWATMRFTAPEAELMEIPRSDLSGVCDRFAATLTAHLTPPPLPGLDIQALARAPLLATLLAGCARPSDAFAALDLVFRGALRHEIFTRPLPTDALSPREEAGA